MKKLHIYISVLSAMLALAACHKPEYKIPDEGSVTIGFTSFTGKFLDDDRDENLFKSETDEVNHIITIVFPYTYPANSTQNREYSLWTSPRIILSPWSTRGETGRSG